MGNNLYKRIFTHKYKTAEAIIVLLFYMAILIGYTLFMA